MREVNIGEGSSELTGDVKDLRLNAGNLVIGAINQLDHGIDRLFRSTINLVQCPFKPTSLDRVFISNSPHGGSCAQETAEHKQSVLKAFLGTLFGLGLKVLLQRFDLIFVLGFDLCYFFDTLFFIVCFELFVLSDLLFDVGNSFLESGFLEGLGFLVCIDFLESYKLLEGFPGVFSNNCIDFGGCVLRYLVSLVAGRNCKATALTNFLLVFRRVLAKKKKSQHQFHHTGFNPDVLLELPEEAWFMVSVGRTISSSRNTRRVSI